MGLRRVLSVRALYLLLAAWALATAAALYLLALNASPRHPAAPVAPRRFTPPPPPRAARATKGQPPWVWSESSQRGPAPDAEGDATPEGWMLDASPLVDTSPPSDDALLASLQEAVPSLPVAFWSAYDKAYKSQKARNCTKLPNIHELLFTNSYWQLLRSSNGSFQLFGAYLDVRNEDSPVVRVLGMIDRLAPIKTYCQLWYEKTIEPIVTEVTEYRYIWNRRWGNGKDAFYQPYLFSCPISLDRTDNPTAVSIVEKPCNKGTNILRIIFNQPEKKKNFAVCVKGLDYYQVDLSVRLVEWIELLGLLGADKIVFYKLNIHPNISKVLNYYEEQGKVQVVPITLPAEEPNLPILQHVFLSKKIIHKRQNEVIPYNDCLYKNLYSYRYITLLDIDEVIMPVNSSSWIELMMNMETRVLAEKKKLPSFYPVRNVYFLDDLMHQHSYFKDIPRYMHMLQHVYRSKNFTKPGAYVKGFHNPESVVTLHNHFPFSCRGNCIIYSLNTRDAQLQHYRSDCVKDLKKTCTEYRTNSIIDTTIWRYKQPLISNMGRVLKKLGFISPGGTTSKVNYT